MAAARPRHIGGSATGYNGLPRVEIINPVVSIDEGDAICFEVCEKHHEKYGDKTMWRIMVDMNSKTLRSVFRCPEGRWYSRWDRHFPSRVSKYFNSIPSTGQLCPAGQMPEAMQNMMNRSVKNNKLQTINNTMGAASPEAAILAVLQEIPGLDRGDMLKAYRILAHEDSGRRFRVLMGLPMDLRKDCVLMEIKA